MITKALLARFESHDRTDDDLQHFLIGARSTVEKEPGTTAWFAIRFGRGKYGVFNAFADDAGRVAHLEGAAASALIEDRNSLLAGLPSIEQLEVLAHRLPPDDLRDVTKGLLLTFKAREGRTAEVAAFLRNARQYVEEEVGTRAWFGIQGDRQHFGIFDVFADTAARFAHLSGHVPRELARHALNLLGGVPEMHLLDVVSVTSRSPPVA